VDGGGIRGLVPALVIAELERRLQDASGEERRVSDYFHLFAGTSTGGLIALSLTAPDPGSPGRPRVRGEQLATFYTEDGPKIFRRSLVQRLVTVDGWAAPKYTLAALKAAIENRLGPTRLESALRDLVVASYDMTAREPYFFKRWRARESAERNQPLIDAALATSAAPTYFPAHEVAGRALVDGGVFAANPVIAAIAEALKRTGDEPANLTPDDLLVVSLGTGLYEQGFSTAQVSGWGKIGWIVPRGDDPPILSAMLGGASDGADHWAHMLLNHTPGDDLPEPTEIGRGPRYFRLQVPLHASIAMDDASPEVLGDRLPAAANALITSHESELTEIVLRLSQFEPLPYDPPPAG
jgi:predicted acylesterase/phospholipase RssA